MTSSQNWFTLHDSPADMHTFFSRLEIFSVMFSNYITIPDAAAFATLRDSLILPAALPPHPPPSLYTTAATDIFDSDINIFDYDTSIFDGMDTDDWTNIEIPQNLLTTPPPDVLPSFPNNIFDNTPSSQPPPQQLTTTVPRPLPVHQQRHIAFHWIHVYANARQLLTDIVHYNIPWDVYVSHTHSEGPSTIPIPPPAHVKIIAVHQLSPREVKSYPALSNLTRHGMLSIAKTSPTLVTTAPTNKRFVRLIEPETTAVAGATFPSSRMETPADYVFDPPATKKTNKNLPTITMPAFNLALMRLDEDHIGRDTFAIAAQSSSPAEDALLRTVYSEAFVTAAHAQMAQLIAFCAQWP